MTKEKSFQVKNIRPFIGAKRFDESRQFYCELGFEEVDIPGKMVLFRVNDSLSFYLQDAWVKDWVDNTMVFLEVDDLEACHKDLMEKGLHTKYKLVRISDIKDFDWGREVFMHDPSGVLWHFGQFKV